MNTRTLETSAIQIQANRLDLLSRLADDIAHEVKNPLHAMVINLELLKRRVTDGKNESALERADVLRQEVGRLHQTVDGLLALFRPPSDRHQDVSLSALIQELAPVLRLQSRFARVELTLSTTSADHVQIVPDAFKQAVLNLVSNALDAMQPDGGRLDLGISTAAHEIALHVRDTGPGIAGDDFEWLTATGTSTIPGRSGLGLAVARTIVTDAGGRIELEDPGGPSSGAGIRLVLPRPPGA